MRSTMMDAPLSIARLVQYGTTTHSRVEVATWTAEGARRASYGEVGRRAAQLAHGLRQLGVTGDQRVATFMWNNQEHMEAYAAVPSMGAVLHTLNLRLFPDQVAYIANHAEDHAILVDNTILPLLARSLPGMKTVQHVVVVGPTDLSVLDGLPVEVHTYADLLAGQPETFDWPEVDERTAAAMCYTSGTTGNPKGVVYSHRSIWLHSMQLCAAEGFGLGPWHKVLAVVPMFHAMSWGVPYGAFMGGSALVMPDRFLQAAPLAAMIEAERPDFAAAVPTIWADLLRHLDRHPADLSSVTEVAIGGSACPPSLIKAFEEGYGIKVLHAWGMTETSPLGSLARPPGGVSGEEEWRYRISQGRLPAGVEGRLVGPDGDFMPHDGESVGELEVRGPWVTGTYYREEDPAKFHDGWLRTGDVGALTADGFLYLTDRSKDVIKSGGEWISSVELENLLMAHPAVVEAAVIAVPDEKWLERPLATVVVKQGASITPAELRTFLGQRVADWQLPEHWSFIDEVPKTSVGKFDKKLLRQRYAEGHIDVRTVQ